MFSVQFKRWVGKGSKKETGGGPAVSSVVLRKLVTWTVCVYLGSRATLMSLDEDGKYACMCSIQHNSLLINLSPVEFSEMRLEPGFPGIRASARWSQQQRGQLPPAGTCQGSWTECEAQGSQRAFLQGQDGACCWSSQLSVQIALASSMDMSSDAKEWVWVPGLVWIHSCAYSLLTEQSVLSAGMRADLFSRWPAWS